MQVQVHNDEVAVLRSLLAVGVGLSALSDRRDILEMVLREARRFARAEAGSLYVLQDDMLQFVAVQNEKMELPDVVRNFLDKKVAVSADSLAGFVAISGRVLNIPDTYELTGSAPFRHNRDFDLATGYRTKSVLAIPLKCPNRRCVGVLTLFNHIGQNGRIVPFAADLTPVLMSLASMAAVSIHNMLLQQELRQAHLDTIIRLSIAAEFRDDDTAKHIRRISRTSAIIAAGLGLDGKTIELIEYASPMHDIGKIGIPDAILLKPGRLTPEQRSVMERHTLIGAEILGESRNELIATAREVALSHHERWDGQGYPHKLSGDRIPLSGRIVGLADVFDALVSRRCYKDAYPPASALNIIRDERGKHFDPKVTDAFFDRIDDIFEAYGFAKEP